MAASSRRPPRGDVTFLVPATGEAAKTTKVDLGEGAEIDPLTRGQAESLRALLDQELTPDGWVAAGEAPSAKGEAGATDSGAPIRVALRSVPTGEIISTSLPLVEDARRDLLVTVAAEERGELRDGGEAIADVRRRINGRLRRGE